jgi:hypothetical protein
VNVGCFFVSATCMIINEAGTRELYCVGKAHSVGFVTSRLIVLERYYEIQDFVFALYVYFRYVFRCFFSA